MYPHSDPSAAELAGTGEVSFHQSWLTQTRHTLAFLRENLATEREAFEQVVATAKAALDEPAFAREWNTGTRLTQDEAIDDALSD